MNTDKNRSAALTASVSSALLAGSLLFQAWGYTPCEMCEWQRWAHAAAAVLATVAILTRGRSVGVLAASAALACAVSGMIGAYQAGIEWKLWEGVTTCAVSHHADGGDILVDIMTAPMVRCDEAAWRLLGISMAGYNALVSIGTAAVATLLLRRRRSVDTLLSVNSPQGDCK
jgi:disulfide bond formation protein DsbB